MPASKPWSTQTQESTCNMLTVNGKIDPAAAFTDLQMEDGTVVRLATATLVVPSVPGADAAVKQPGSPSETFLSLVEERLEVGRRTVDIGRVRLHKTVQEYETELNEELAVRTFEVERVILNKPVEFAPAVRQEGDTTIYPLLEERVIVTRELILTEELRVTRHDSLRTDARPITLRRERLTVERDHQDGIEA